MSSVKRRPLIQAIVCDSCDMMLEDIDVEPGHTVFCPRCGSKLYVPRADSCNRTLAFSITALILFYPAMVMPIMSLYTFGMEQSASVVGSIFKLFDKGYVFVSLIALLTVFVFPLFRLLLLLCVSLGLKCRKDFFRISFLMRCYHYLDEWSMPEVYMLGILVTIIKIYHLAYIRYDTGLFCFVGLILAITCASTTMDERFYWNAIEKLQTGNR